MSEFDNQPQAPAPDQHDGNNQPQQDQQSDPGVDWVNEVLEGDSPEQIVADESQDGADDEPAEDDETGYDEEISQNYRGNAGLDWNDAAAIAQFAVSFNAKNASYRDDFRNLIGNWGDSVEIARAIYPAGNRVLALDLVLDFVNIINNDPSQIMGLTVRVMEHSSDMLKSMTHVFNYLVENYPAKEDSPSLSFRYRSNMPNLDVLMKFQAMATSINEDGVKRLEWANMLVAIWPGNH